MNGDAHEAGLSTVQARIARISARCAKRRGGSEAPIDATTRDECEPRPPAVAAPAAPSPPEPPAPRPWLRPPIPFEMIVPDDWVSDLIENGHLVPMRDPGAPPTDPRVMSMLRARLAGYRPPRLRVRKRAPVRAA
jgi:hypothetical protein